MLRVLAIAFVISIGLLAERQPVFAQGGGMNCEQYCSSVRCRQARSSTCMIKCVDACKKKHHG